MELDYERRYQHVAYVYESIMQAQKVKLDDIPLLIYHQRLQQQQSLSVAPKSIPKSVSTNLMQQTPSSSQFMILSTRKELLLKYGRCDENGDESGGVPQAPSGSAPPDLAELECDTDEHELGLNKPILKVNRTLILLLLLGRGTNFLKNFLF
jgi:hypothetical protein